MMIKLGDAVRLTYPGAPSMTAVKVEDGKAQCIFLNQITGEFFTTTWLPFEALEVVK